MHMLLMQLLVVLLADGYRQDLAGPDSIQFCCIGLTNKLD